MIFLVTLIVTSVFSCATTEKADRVERPEPPQITRDMELEEALAAAVNFGGDTARDVRKLITKRKEWPLAEKTLFSSIESGIKDYQNPQLANAVMLYVSGPVKPSEPLFKKLISSDRKLARQLGWQMAAALPGKVMRGAIDRELNRALMEGDDEDLLVPQMAAAVQANRMPQAYTIVRRGLMTTGHEDFATAMSVLDPDKASNDFLDYLALCPPEELRQLTVSSVNVYAATVALNHLLRHPPSSAHPRLETVFYYAISRNPGFSEIGGSLVESLLERYQNQMALILSRQPSWAQIAFIENSRRNMTNPRRMFLSELKKLSPQPEVVEELSETQL